MRHRIQGRVTDLWKSDHGESKCHAKGAKEDGKSVLVGGYAAQRGVKAKERLARSTKGKKVACPAKDANCQRARLAGRVSSLFEMEIERAENGGKRWRTR